MSGSFKINKNGDVLKIRDGSSGYVLVYDPEERDIYEHEITFYGPVNGSGFVNITCRDVEQRRYHPQIVSSANYPNSGRQIVEVGAGLGELVPLLARRRQSPVPVVIDPVNYKVLKEMLRYLKYYSGDRINLMRIDELVARAEIILDPRKVRLINMTLGEALRRHPELKGEADVLVDNNGASEWGEVTENKKIEDIIKMEMKLLNDSGILYTRKEIYIKNG